MGGDMIKASGVLIFLSVVCVLGLPSVSNAATFAIPWAMTSTEMHLRIADDWCCDLRRCRPCGHAFSSRGQCIEAPYCAK